MRFLIIGLGSMGKRRVRNLQALRAGEITGFDPRADRRAEAEARYRIKTVEDAERGFSTRPDAAIISTPPDLHIPFALEAARRGVHFFTEAGVMDDGVEELLDVCRERPGLVGVPSCTMRYAYGPRKIGEILRKETIGRPLTFVYHCGQWLPDWHPWEDYRTFYASKRATGACREIVPFELNWLTQNFGLVREVEGFAGKLSDLETDIDDIYQCLFRFESEVAGFMQVDVLARAPVRHFRLVGVGGTLEWDAAEHEVRIYRAVDKQWEIHPLPRGTVVPGYADWSLEEPYVEEIRDFIAACRGEWPFGYSFEEDRRLLDVVRAVERSHQEGRRIALNSGQRGHSG